MYINEKHGRTRVEKCSGQGRCGHCGCYVPATPIPASVSYAPKNVKRCEKRAAAIYQKTAQKCRLLTMKNQLLETRVANLARQNQDLRAELAMLFEIHQET